jgi:hypothetical protein
MYNNYTYAYQMHQTIKINKQPSFLIKQHHEFNYYYCPDHRKIYFDYPMSSNIL